MCHFITMTVNGPIAALDSALIAADRRAIPLRNDSIQGLLVAGEQQIFAQSKTCDCGTVLGSRWSEGDEEPANEEAEHRAKLARRGWSSAKIERSMDEWRKIKARPKPSRGPDHGLPYWAEIVRSTLAQPGVASVGVLVHGYSGTLETEAFTCSRRDVFRTPDVEAALAGMSEDELLVFHSRRNTDC